MATTIKKTPQLAGFAKLASPSKSQSSTLNSIKKQINTSTKKAAAPKTSSYSSTGYNAQSKNQGFGTSTAANKTQSKVASTAAPAARSTSTPAQPGPSAQQQMLANNLSSTLANATTQSLINGAASALGGTPTTNGSTMQNGASPNYAPSSAFGKSFAPSAYQDMMSNPDALIRAWYAFNNKGTNGGELAMAQNAFADNLMLLHTMFGKPAGNDKAWLGEFGPYADFADPFMRNMTTPGASTYSAGQITDRLMNTTDKNDPIYTQLYSELLTPAQQANNFISAWQSATSSTMAPEVQMAYQMRLAELEQQFIAEKGQGKHAGQTFADFLRANGWG